MKKALAMTLAASMAAASVYADAISINWKEFTGGVNDVAAGYGVEAANNWLNSQKGATGTDLTLSSGAASTIDYSVTGGGWDTWGFAAQDNTAMRAGIAVYAAGSSVTLSQLNGTFSTYDVIVYVGGFNAALNSASITDGTITYYAEVPNPFTTSLIQSTDTDFSDGADAGTYVRFNGLTADSTTITMNRANSTAVGIGGIQVVGTVIPEPATAGLMAFLGGGLMWVRRRFML